MKKIVGIIIVILLVGFLIWKQKGITSEKNPYIEKGYTEAEVKKIESLSKENQSYLLEEDYQADLLSYFRVKNMDESKLKRYLHFGKLYNLSIDDTIFIVNQGYDNLEQYDSKTLCLMHSDYYIHQYLDRYLNYKATAVIDFVSLEAECAYIISAVNGNLDYSFYEHDQEADLTKGYLLLVNKYYKLPDGYVPKNLVTIAPKYGIQAKLEKTVYDSYVKMWEAASKEGLTLYINSPYRSYQTQQTLYQNYVNRDGKKAADTYSARPGYSEHQTGLAFDVTSKTTNFDTFENSKEFKWMQEHAYEYGFILRYPKGKEYMTGYIYEPWHYRYVGTEVSKKIHDTGLTYEEYYAYYVR